MKTTKTTDDKGRLVLGRRFANRTVIVEETDPTELRIILARVVPEREAWLFENETAVDRVMEGLRQAAGGEFSATPPNLDADAALADSLEES
ncbi:MAG: hypothetical protein PVI86_09325 [Phycisphaerae bacterium]|jgi:hypothetical protein